MWVERQGGLDLLERALDVGPRQIDLIDGRNDRQLVDHGELGVGQFLGFNALRSVHHQQRTLAHRKAPRDLIKEKSTWPGVSTSFNP